MDTIFMNSTNSKTSYPHRLLINLSDKISWNKWKTMENVIQKQ